METHFPHKDYTTLHNKLGTLKVIVRIKEIWIFFLHDESVGCYII